MKIYFSLMTIFFVSTSLAQTPAEIFQGVQCLSQYNELNQRKELEGTVVHGYLDSGDNKVHDIYYKNRLVSLITGPCRKGQLNCKFHRHPDDAEKFYRNIIGLDGKLKRVVFYISHSSVTNVDSDNRADPKQKWQTEHARAVFKHGLEHSDFILYDGHSRDGGGPDFSPAKMLWGTHTDYDWYRANKPGLKFMVDVLNATKSDTRMLALFSCISNKHFFARSMSAAPQSGFIGTDDLLYFGDQTSDTFMNDFLNFKCLDQQPYPAPVKFKKWWAVKPENNISTEAQINQLHERRINNLVDAYMGSVMMDDRVMIIDELGRYKDIPESTKQKIMKNMSKNMWANILYNKWLR